VTGVDIPIRSGGLMLVTGKQFPKGTGRDFAGEVAAIDPAEAGFKVGDAVWGFIEGFKPSPSAAAAEYVLAPLGGLALRPRTIDAIGAAALSGAAAAALGVLRDAAKVRKGDRVLVRGANGGVGVAAIQIAKVMGAQVTALVSTTGQIAQAQTIGGGLAFDYHTIQPRELGRFDVIIDPVGRGMSAFRRLLDKDGVMACVAVPGPGGIAYILASSVHGSRRVRFVRMPPTGKLLGELTPFVDEHGVKPVIDSEYTLDTIADAHRSLERSGGFGKRVVRSV
ncbi:MAG TPA: NAD(P)-dependent alcohol dehydrogenase, partial [Caulobacteraceae bacterium]|nr:NAD(P)-dependent alcohol dehydrogenase [Caulobacteraceae bacterium]